MYGNEGGREVPVSAWTDGNKEEAPVLNPPRRLGGLGVDSGCVDALVCAFELSPSEFEVDDIG